jgi:indole-3-acetate monooxygenase
MNIEAPIPKGQAIADPVQRARQLRPLIEGAVPEIERDRALPQRLLAAVHDAGLFRLLLPRSCGGEEVEPAVFVAAVEEIAKGDASTAWCMAQGSGCSMTAAYIDPAIAREIFGGKEAVLAWGPSEANAKATAIKDGYCVSGTWSYARASIMPRGSAVTLHWSMRKASRASAPTASRPSEPCCS